MEIFRHSVALNGNPEVNQHGSGSNASGSRDGLGDPGVVVPPRRKFPVVPAKGTPGPEGKYPKHGAPVRRADTGDIQSVERELYSALLPTNPKVGVEIMAKVGNSCKKG